MRKNQKRIIGLFCFVLLLVVVYQYGILKNIAISTYQIVAIVVEPIRIVQLTDLHNSEFGVKNCELITLVEEQNPDIIVMTGDMINRDNEDLSVIKYLISELVNIAPVYYGYGNHEVAWEENYNSDLRSILFSTGAIVVNNDFLDIKLKNQEVRIGGYMGYFHKAGMLSDRSKWEEEDAFADDFENTDRLKILLNHIPTQWVDWDYINKYPVDIVFSGHYHGGMIRIPFIDRGIYAPYVGLFPKNTKGVFEGSQATCILSAGLGSEYFVPRINNPPEIVVVDLVPAS